MQDFQFYITDDRYGVPSLMMVQTGSVERARFLAGRLLAEKHHHAVEVWANDQRLFAMTEAEFTPGPPRHDAAG